jgi:hypothetical protein
MDVNRDPINYKIAGKYILTLEEMLLLEIVVIQCPWS